MPNFLRVQFFFIIFFVYHAYCSDIFTIPHPDRIGGMVNVGDQMLTHENDDGYKFIVSREDGTLFSPSAEVEGLNTYNYYKIDIPIKDLFDQPNGATPGETVRINVYKNATQLTVLSPKNGIFTVSGSGIPRQLNLELKVPDPELVIKKDILDFGNQAIKTLSSPLILTIQNVSTMTKNFSEITIYGGFSIASNTCGTAIDAKTTCQIAVQFFPDKPVSYSGDLSGELTIRSDAIESPQKITLTGDGIIQNMDINGDTKINLEDVIITLQLCSGSLPNSPFYKEADVNQDGNIDIEEAIGILYFILNQNE